jgi:hypothetical protein
MAAFGTPVRKGSPSDASEAERFSGGGDAGQPEGVQAISLWDDRKSADVYQTATYPQVLAKLTPVIEGTPTVETYENAASYARA